MNIIKMIAEICSNEAYAVIIAAIIGGPTTAAIVAYLHKRKKTPELSESIETIKIDIPPPIDPLDGLNADVIGMKKISEENFNSSEYIKSLASRISMLKNPNSIAEIYYEENDNE